MTVGSLRPSLVASAFAVGFQCREAIRKRGAMLALLFVACVSAAQAQTPVADWEFDAGSGTAVVDGSGAGNVGTLRAAAAWADGLSGAHSLRLPGRADSFCETERAVVDTSRSYTVLACVKLKRATGWQTVVSLDGSRVSGFFLQLREDTGEFAFTTLSTDDPTGETATAGSKCEPLEDVWYALAGVFDASAHTLTLYVNGTLQQTVPVRAAWRATGRTVVGRGKYNGHPVDFLDGDVDSVRFYDSALSAVEIHSLCEHDVPASVRDAALAAPQTASIRIDAAHPGHAVSATQHGLMTEEINHAYDGGLYGELIQNRAFRNNDVKPDHWTLVQGGSARGSLRLDSSQSTSRALPVSLKLTATIAASNQRLGVANDGYWGIPVTPNTTYRASLYAKAAPGFVGPLTLEIESADGAISYAAAKIPKLTEEWKQYRVTLRTGALSPSLDTRFVVSLNHPGAVWLNLISLFPPTFHGRPNGNRVDLMEKLSALKPTFLRFPGGNYLEGDDIVDRFDWKRTLGDLTQRPGHQAPWGYRSTDGLGLMEFLDWCDDLHMEPLLAVYAGYSLNHYRNPNPQRVTPGPALQPFVQDALDEIEFLVGAASTKWGAERARLGHPVPFALHYVEIGNEDWFDASGSYDARFAQFFDAIKAKYPGLQLIATTRTRSRKPDVIDEHYYLSPRTFERDTHHYDHYDRAGPKIFVGEWASQEGDPTADLNSALGDAAWLTGLERNSDIVVMETYAPLLVNVNPGGSQWPHPNLIGYNALTSFASPSFYAQAMFAANRGAVCLPAIVTGAPRLACSVTRDAAGKTVYIKIVNPGANAQAATVTIDGVRSVAPKGDAIVLTSASPKDQNSLAELRKVVPRTSSVRGLGSRFAYTFAPYSVTVLRLSAH